MPPLQINGQTVQVDAPPEMPLLWVLRDLLGLTGTKYSCGMGLCGTCVVHVDGEVVRSCITEISSIGDKRVTTIEGLSPDASHLIQRLWIEENAAQCGYCMPGQIMVATALLAHNPHPNAETIAAEMSSVLCRCGSYQRIRSAIERAIKEGGAS